MLPKRFPDRDEIAAVREVADGVEPGTTDDSKTFRLAGRVLARREMGKLTFLDLVDRSGRIQLLAGKVDVDLGDIVGVERQPGQVAPRRALAPGRSSSSCWRRTARRCRTPSTASPTSSCATASATSTC